MAIEVVCPDCQRQYRVKDSRAGGSVKCRTVSCAARIAVPEAQDSYGSYPGGLPDGDALEGLLEPDAAIPGDRRKAKKTSGNDSGSGRSFLSRMTGIMGTVSRFLMPGSYCKKCQGPLATVAAKRNVVTSTPGGAGDFVSGTMEVCPACRGDKCMVKGCSGGPERVAKRTFGYGSGGKRVDFRNDSWLCRYHGNIRTLRETARGFGLLTGLASIGFGIGYSQRGDEFLIPLCASGGVTLVLIIVVFAMRPLLTRRKKHQLEIHGEYGSTWADRYA